MKFVSNWLRSAVLAAPLVAVPALAAAADNYPTKPVRVVVGFAPGGAVDMAGRLMAQSLQQALGQSFVVENKPGVGGLLALQDVARAAPDGYTLVVGSAGPLTVSPSLFKSYNFDPRKALDPVVWFVNTPGIIVVRKDLPAKNVDELLKLSKTGDLSMGSAGAGGVMHLMGEYFQHETGVKWTHIPYKGSSPALADMVAGRIDVMIDVVPSAAPFVKNGDIRALAVTTRDRSTQLPDTPTLEELGYKGFDMGSWMALMAPKGTPPAILEKLNSVLNKSLQDKAVTDRIIATGGEPVGGEAKTLAEKIDVELTRWDEIMTRAGLERN